MILTIKLKTTSKNLTLVVRIQVRFLKLFPSVSTAEEGNYVIEYNKALFQMDFFNKITKTYRQITSDEFNAII